MIERDSFAFRPTCARGPQRRGSARQGDGGRDPPLSCQGRRPSGPSHAPADDGKWCGFTEGRQCLPGWFGRLGLDRQGFGLLPFPRASSGQQEGEPAGEFKRLDVANVDLLDVDRLRRRR